jgi:hypothetical protein
MFELGFGAGILIGLLLGYCYGYPSGRLDEAQRRVSRRQG